MRHLLSAADLDRTEIGEILDLAEEMSLVQGRAGQETAGATWPDRGQLVLRGLHPNSVLVRDRRQMAVGRCDQYQREGLVGIKG